MRKKELDYTSIIQDIINDMILSNIKIFFTCDEEIRASEEYEFYTKFKEHYVISCIYMYLKEKNLDQLFIKVLNENTYKFTSKSCDTLIEHLTKMNKELEIEWVKNENIIKLKKIANLKMLDLVNYYYFNYFYESYSTTKDLTHSQFLHDILAETKSAVIKHLESYMR